MDVSNGIDHNGRNVGVYKRHKGLNYQWDVIYVNEMPAPLKKGDTNEDFGLKVETDFHIVTEMKSGRYIDLIGNNMVLKTPNSFPS